MNRRDFLKDITSATMSLAMTMGAVELQAVGAGKHGYCEAPLATDLDEAKEIARAGLAAKTVFQGGLQQRCNKQHEHVYKFVQSGQLGQIAYGRAQHHERNSWRRVHPD